MLEKAKEGFLRGWESRDESEPFYRSVMRSLNRIAHIRKEMLGLQLLLKTSIILSYRRAKISCLDFYAT